MDKCELRYCSVLVSFVFASVFLDLPSPWEAVESGKTALKASLLCHDSDLQHLTDHDGCV